MRATDFLRQVGHPIPPPPQEIPPRRNMCATGLHNSNFPEVVRPVQRLGGGGGDVTNLSPFWEETSRK